MAAKSDSSTILTLPPDLANMRSQFFSPPDASISLTRAEFDKLWPYMDNMYTLSKRHPPTNDGTQSVYYNCRFFRTKDYIPVDIAKRQRNRSCRTATGCPAKLKLVFYGQSRVEISRSGPGLHNHDLREIDSAKRNTAIRELAADEVAKGYKPSHVHRNLRGGRCEANHKILDTADGFNLSLKDVHNAGKSWLAVNKDVRLLGAEQPWQLQQDDAMEALINREWQVTKLDTIRESDSKFLKILIIICMLFSHD